MSAIYDWRCPKCGKIEEDMPKSVVGIVCMCGEDMKKLPAKPQLVRLKENIK